MLKESNPTTVPSNLPGPLIQRGVNCRVRCSQSGHPIADAVLKWADKILAPDWQPRVLVNAELLSFEYFEREFLKQLRAHGLVGPE